MNRPEDLTKEGKEVIYKEKQYVVRWVNLKGQKISLLGGAGIEHTTVDLDEFIKGAKKDTSGANLSARLIYKDLLKQRKQIGAKSSLFMKKPIKVTYTLWLSIEKFTEYSDGSESHENLEEEETRSVGTFKSIEEALSEINLLGEIYQGER